MEIVDIAIEDLYKFFSSLSSAKTDNELKNNNSIIPYLAFIISINDRAYDCLMTKIKDWNNNRISNEYEKCPWINCKFVTRMIDLEKEKRVSNILLYLCSNDANDNEVYQILSIGWKRIALYVESKEVIDINEAPLRNKVEEKWVLCFLSYIKHKMIVQAKNRDEWYRFSSELFFYFEYIIQLMDIDSLHSESSNGLASYNQEMLYIDVDENIEYTEGNIISFQALLLLREKEHLIKKCICGLDMNKSKTVSTSHIGSLQKENTVVDKQIQGQDGLCRQIEYYESHVTELEKRINEVIAENLRLKNTLELLNEEISLLRIPDDENIVLEDECDWDYLHKKKIVICGGRLEWINRIKYLFPQWKYIENDNIRFDGQILKDTNIDTIVFNKRFVSHGLFYRVASQKAKSVPLIYINSCNVEFALQTICNKLKMME